MVLVRTAGLTLTKPFQVPGCDKKGMATRMDTEWRSSEYSAFSLQETADSAQYKEKVAHTDWNGRLATHILL